MGFDISAVPLGLLQQWEIVLIAVYLISPVLQEPLEILIYLTTKVLLSILHFSSKRSCTSRDIQLQCLDARALLQRTATSTPASSLDLEWEHETLPASMIHDPSGSSWTALPEDISCCPTTSHTHNSEMNANASDSDWSRVSSANSLEWDNVQNSIQAEGSPPISELDTDTQFLLGEIERLTNKTLEETGKELFS
uniref:Uncharacterized protein LOC114330525 isoform X2 n=1 Tax=Diabrotica virgifera virgifera TaxID=50390 RepID=A0A6P7FKZ7_DIAVI